MDSNFDYLIYLFFFALGAAVVIMFLPLIAPTYVTSTFSLNSNSGVLTINATFFGGELGSQIYPHYIINNATEELPNGTVIYPPKSYVEAEIAAACTTNNNQLYIGKGDYYAC